MRGRRGPALAWTLAGLALCALALAVVLTGLEGAVLVADPAGVPAAAEGVLSSVRDGDDEALRRLLQGSPDLGTAPREDSAAGRLWSAYRQSLRWTCAGGFEVRGEQVLQRVDLEHLDLAALTPELAEAPAQGGTVRREITLTLVREDGAWLVVPDAVVLALLSGFL